MLVLAREIGERIFITDQRNPTQQIILTITDIQGQKVKIGIEAADYFRVDREEVAIRRAESMNCRGAEVR